MTYGGTNRRRAKRSVRIELAKSGQKKKKRREDGREEGKEGKEKKSGQER